MTATKQQNVAAALAADDEIPHLIALVAAEFPELPVDESAVRRVHKWSSSVFTVKKDGAVIGGFAVLFLNNEGNDAMLKGVLPMTAPPLHMLARSHEKVAAVYLWMLVSRRHGEATADEFWRVIGDRAPRTNIYGRPVRSVQGFFSGCGGAPLFEGSPIWVMPA